MTNRASGYLSDKDIRKLKSKEVKYVKAVGKPKELNIWINKNGIKFLLKNMKLLFLDKLISNK